jgi:hypothetical protein
MAISPDVFASVLQELTPGYSEMFTKWHPLMENVVLRGNVPNSQGQGPYREFAVVTGGPGRVTQINSGSELVRGGRRQNAIKGNAYAPRQIYVFDVPKKDLADANGKQDLVQLIKRYPETALSDFHERISNQVASGNGEDVSGFMTLNGNATYSPDGTSRAGVFKPEATGLQTGTVFGLDKAAVDGWNHQYANITGFGSDGRRQLRKAYYAASRQGSKTDGLVDLLLADEGTYLNYLDDLDDQVRVVNGKVSGDSAPNDVRQGIAFMNAMMYLEDSIQLDQFADNAANGVCYMLHTASWQKWTKGGAGPETKGDFVVEGPIDLPDGDMVRYRIILNMNFYCDHLRRNALVTGGATA